MIPALTLSFHRSKQDLDARLAIAKKRFEEALQKQK
jgi:hypothetical protein